MRTKKPALPRRLHGAFCKKLRCMGWTSPICISVGSFMPFRFTQLRYWTPEYWAAQISSRLYFLQPISVCAGPCCQYVRQAATADKSQTLRSASVSWPYNPGHSNLSIRAVIIHVLGYPTCPPRLLHALLSWSTTCRVAGEKILSGLWADIGAAIAVLQFSRLALLWYLA